MDELKLGVNELRICEKSQMRNNNEEIKSRTLQVYQDSKIFTDSTQTYP